VTAANPITPAVLAHLPVLEHLKAVGSATAAEIAAATDRVYSTVKRDLPKLVTAGLLVDDGQPAASAIFRLGGDGEAGLAAMARAANPDATGGVPFALTSELKPNPKQPRKKFDEEALERLADTIDEKGILQPLVVRPAGEDGLRVISAGERRWRAACIVNDRRVARDDQNGPVLLPYIERDATPEEQAEEEAYAAYIAVVENGQREPLTTYEEALAYRAMIPALYPSARACGKATGVDGKTVSDRLKALEDLTEPQKAEWRDGKLTWREVRDIFRPPAPAQTDPNQMDLEELTGKPIEDRGAPSAQAAETHPTRSVPTNASIGTPGGLTGAYTSADMDLHLTLIGADMPADFEAAIEVARGVVDDFNTASRNVDIAAGRAARDRFNACLQKLNGGKTLFGVDFGPESVGARVRTAIAAAPGSEPKWGQPGKFLLRVDGMTAAVVIADGFSTQTQFYAVDLDAPFLSCTGYHCAAYAGSNYLPTATGASVATRVAMEMRSLIERSTLPIGDAGRADRAAFIAAEVWIGEALAAGRIIDGDALIAEHFAEEPQAQARAHPAPQGPADRSSSLVAEAPSSAELPREARIALIEATHKLLTQNVISAGRATRIGAYWLDPNCSLLVAADLLRFVNPGGENGWCVMWGDKAYAWMKANAAWAFNERGDLAITDKDLKSVQSAKSDWTSSDYRTAWLNVEPSEPSVPAIDPSPEAEAEAVLADQDMNDDEDAFDALLTQLRKEMGRTHGEPGHWTRVSAPDLAVRAFSELLRGDALAAIAALVGVMEHTGDLGETARLLHAAGKGDNRPEGKEPHAILWYAANAVRDLMLKHYEVFNGLPDADFVYRDLSGALNDVSRAKRQDDDVLLVIRKGDVVEKHPGAATQHRILEAQGAIGGRVLFKAQPMRGGKDFGSPGSLPLSDFANFIRGGGR
jgi:hypothetical protein